jgi:hypothetical protein
MLDLSDLMGEGRDSYRERIRMPTTLELRHSLEVTELLIERRTLQSGVE